MHELEGSFARSKVFAETLEDSCTKQILQMLNHPAFTNPVAIMPDAHAGNGAVVGFTMRMTDKLIPNVVGVDIGCGMLAYNLGQVELDHASLDAKIRTRVPFGAAVHKTPVVDFEKHAPWAYMAMDMAMVVTAMTPILGAPRIDMRVTPALAERTFSRVGGDMARHLASLGSLGGGNHFIEFGRAQVSGDMWVVLHSGSRNFGKLVCDFWQNRAKSNVQSLGVPKGMEFLTGDDAWGYLADMVLTQTYAAMNRTAILDIILGILGLYRDQSRAISTVHNYINPQDQIIRKGAIRANRGEKVIIPFNMRDGWLLCEGLGNPDWNYSAPHGAGRALPRGVAKRSLSVTDFQEQMQGIFSTSVGDDTLDEAPDAYKPAAEIEATIGETVTILDRIRPVHNLKA